MTYIELQQ